jgi:hypothetical protein
VEEPPVNAILLNLVQFFETLVLYSFGSVFLVLAAVGTIVLLRNHGGSDPGGSYGRFGTRPGSGSVALAAVLAVALALLLAGLTLWAR